MKQTTLCAAAALLVAGCTPSIEYGRRSVNEPAFPVIYAKPKVIIGSSAQPPDKGESAAPAGGDGSPVKARIDYSNMAIEDVAKLRKAFDDEAPEPKFNGNRTVFKRTLVAAITKGEYRPADRFVNFRLRITPDNFEFVDYKSTATDYSVVNIEKLSLEKSNSAGLELVGGKPVEATIKAGTARTLTESGDVSVRVENTTTNIDYRTLDIYREAERGIDLSGNTLVNVSVTSQRQFNATQTDVDYIATALKLTDKGKLLPPAQAEIKTSFLQYLKPRDLTAKISFDYVIRRVAVRANEYSEHNQTAYYELGNCTQSKAVIVRARDLDIPRWSIAARYPGQGRTVVQLQNAFGAFPLAFTDYVKARQLMDWMRLQRARSAGEQQFVLDGLAGGAPPGVYPDLSIVASSEVWTDAAEGAWDCSTRTVQ
ncbi:hypothetical protein [Pseudoduganella aquatica]|uniref:Uncharacterized protein n=1 Tax=Pseudoduganella aquatica TaxID=2660641 RepID=A0A7X4HAN8_9BURK|nr:hypothetical protein [Pseudoduganella aquatica]MYN07754.1 hypothetical protein [Pseudoduganella aquatica]